MGGLLRPKTGDTTWRLAFVLGLLAAPAVYGLWAGPVSVTVDAAWGTVVLAGLLVGVGTRYGAGCTSGHGVYGLSRLSPRSLVATLVFMAAGFATVYLNFSSACCLAWAGAWRITAPGPATVSLGMGNPKALVFVLAMLAGMAVFEFFESRY